MIELLIAGLAVYKVMQLLDALTPREAMPWVKVIASIVLGYVSCLLTSVPNFTLGGLAVAALAGTVHAVLRLFTLAGDLAHKRSLR